MMMIMMMRLEDGSAVKVTTIFRVETTYETLAHLEGIAVHPHRLAQAYRE
jgi:hypothetical protein